MFNYRWLEITRFLYLEWYTNLRNKAEQTKDSEWHLMCIGCQKIDHRVSTPLDLFTESAQEVLKIYHNRTITPTVAISVCCLLQYQNVVLLNICGGHTCHTTD